MMQMPKRKRSRRSKNSGKRKKAKQMSQSEEEEEEDPEALPHEDYVPEDEWKKYCICQTKNDPGKPMICCDMCDEWFHHACLGLDSSMKYEKEVEWHCPGCLMSSGSDNFPTDKEIFKQGIDEYLLTVCLPRKKRERKDILQRLSLSSWRPYLVVTELVRDIVNRTYGDKLMFDLPPASELFKTYAKSRNTNDPFLEETYNTIWRFKRRLDFCVYLKGTSNSVNVPAPFVKDTDKTIFTWYGEFLRDPSTVRFGSFQAFCSETTYSEMIDDDAEYPTDDDVQVTREVSDTDRQLEEEGSDRGSVEAE